MLSLKQIFNPSSADEIWQPCIPSTRCTAGAHKGCFCNAFQTHDDYNLEGQQQQINGATSCWKFPSKPFNILIKKFIIISRLSLSLNTGSSFRPAVLVYLQLRVCGDPGRQPNTSLARTTHMENKYCAIQRCPNPINEQTHVNLIYYVTKPSPRTHPKWG